MSLLARGGKRLALMAMVLGIWVGFESSATAQAGPGRYEGLQGFGLSYHLGRGYGGDSVGVGVGPFGGYPFYGGPGYPHAEPRLRRLGKIAPTVYQGGHGDACQGSFNRFQGVGPLVVRPNVVEVGDMGQSSGFGQFTGTLPYPDSLFAPYAGDVAVATTAASHGRPAKRGR